MTISNISTSFQETHTHIHTHTLWHSTDVKLTKNKKQKERNIKTFRYLEFISHIDSHTLLSRQMQKSCVCETKKSFKQIMLGHTWDSQMYLVGCARMCAGICVRMYIHTCIYYIVVCAVIVFSSLLKIFYACMNNRWEKQWNNAHRIECYICAREEMLKNCPPAPSHTNTQTTHTLSLSLFLSFKIHLNICTYIYYTAL